MTPMTLVVVLVVSVVVGIVISYAVIRAAVCAGILDADRKRELAEAERKQVTSNAGTGQPKPTGSWVDRIVG